MKSNDLFSISAQGIPSLNDGYRDNISSISSLQIKEEPFGFVPIMPGIEKLIFKEKPNRTASRKLDICCDDSFIFISNQENPLSITLAGEKFLDLGQYQNLLISGNAHLPVVFNLQKDEDYNAAVFVFKSARLRSYLSKSYPEIFDKPSFYFKSRANLEVSDYISKVINCDNKFPSNMMAWGYINIITALLFKSYLRQENEKKYTKSSLRKWEIAELQKITAMIRENPEQDYTVNELAEQSGVSIPKLQKGFKEMHGTTVSNFIRDVRLEKAEELIQTTDLNISEIVYTIGLSSRSYFSRIFKERYHCSPSDYQKERMMQNS